MDNIVLFTIPAVAIPFIATLMLVMGNGTIAERHHSHHDTYVIAGTFTSMLVFAMIVMGTLGILLGWLCTLEVFTSDSVVVMGFFDAFIVVAFAGWLLLRRYKVVTYDDYMTVTPFVGLTVSIAYDKISSMEWLPSILLPGSRNMRVYVDGRRRALLWGALDLEQILIRINRFDALVDVAAES